MKKIINLAIGIIMAASLMACEIHDPGKTDVSTDILADNLPSDLSEDDFITVAQINEESHLIRNLYEEVEGDEEPYEILEGEGSSAIALHIPKNKGSLRFKEIDMQDHEYDLYGMSIGTPRTEFENTMINKGFNVDGIIESMKYESFRKGNIYVGISYNDSEKVNRIFLNLVLDYNEWRGIE